MLLNLMTSRATNRHFQAPTLTLPKGARLCMAGRGRARGQAVSETGKKKEPSTSRKPPQTPKNIDELAEYLYSLNEGNLDIHGSEFADMVVRFADNETKLIKTVDLVFDTTVASREYSELGGSVCELIVRREEGNFGSIFLKKLLQRFQSEVKHMEEIRNKSIEGWLGVFSFLCEVYRKIKVGNKPITIVGKNILQYICTMLSNSDVIDDEIDTICTKLKVCGRMLEEQSDGLEKVIVEFRKQVIHKKSSCWRRCVIMELIELRLLGWNDHSGNLDKFYVDAIADAMVEDEVGENNNP